MSNEKYFPKGFASWIETYHEVVAHLHTTEFKPNDAPDVEQQPSMQVRANEENGMIAVYELAEQLTDIFETRYIDQDWHEVSFWETVDEFCLEMENKYPDIN